MTANRVLTALVVLAVLTALLAAGIALIYSGPATVVAQGTAAVTQRYTTADIDAALASGPVFLEFETEQCGYCKQQRPITEALASEYEGKVTFIFVDANENRELARAFQVSGVPQMDIILDKKDGYTFVGKDGVTSDSIGASRFLGLTQKDTLKTALDAAVRMRGQ
ncbi:MAG: thioredoxin [Methanocella sp. PtaU1.Bin125]|nr:MAG: thioredoxin [Methanocella sp. PtaU1.Bin125]